MSATSGGGGKPATASPRGTSLKVDRPLLRGGGDGDDNSSANSKRVRGDDSGGRAVQTQDKEVAAPRQVCRFHLRGACDFGRKCRNLHQSPDVAATVASASTRREPGSGGATVHGSGGGGGDSQSRIPVRPAASHPRSSPTSVVVGGDAERLLEMSPEEWPLPSAAHDDTRTFSDLAAAATTFVPDERRSAPPPPPPSASLSVPVRDKDACRYYLRIGVGCIKGDACPYRHDVDRRELALSQGVYECRCGAMHGRAYCHPCHIALRSQPCAHLLGGCRRRVPRDGMTCRPCSSHVSYQCGTCLDAHPMVPYFGPQTRNLPSSLLAVTDSPPSSSPSSIECASPAPLIDELRYFPASWSLASASATATGAYDPAAATSSVDFSHHPFASYAHPPPSSPSPSACPFSGAFSGETGPLSSSPYYHAPFPFAAAAALTPWFAPGSLLRAPTPPGFEDSRDTRPPDAGRQSDGGAAAESSYEFASRSYNYSSPPPSIYADSTELAPVVASASASADSARELHGRRRRYAVGRAVDSATVSGAAHPRVVSVDPGPSSSSSSSTAAFGAIPGIAASFSSLRGDGGGTDAPGFADQSASVPGLGDAGGGGNADNDDDSEVRAILVQAPGVGATDRDASSNVLPHDVAGGDGVSCADATTKLALSTDASRLSAADVDRAGVESPADETAQPLPSPPLPPTLPNSPLGSPNSLRRLGVLPETLRISSSLTSVGSPSHSPHGVGVAIRN